MEKLRPLHSLHQNICSATLPPAFAASFLRKSTTTPQELQWNVVVGVRPSRDHQFIWYETLLDVMGIEKVFTVEGAAIRAVEMPERVKARWCGDGLSAPELEGAVNQGREQLDLLIAITPSLTVTVPLEKVDQPTSIGDILNLIPKMNPNWHLSGKNAEENKSLQRESGRIRTERDTLRSEVAFQKGKVAELEKALAEGSSGGVMGPRGSPSQQERKMGVLGSQVGGGSPTKKAKHNHPSNRPPPQKQALRVTIADDDPNGGFIDDTDSD